MMAAEIEAKYKKLWPLDTVELRGERIREVLFAYLGGGEKTILVFESGRTLLLPVHRTCAVQEMPVAWLIEDMQELHRNMLRQTEQKIQDQAAAIVRLDAFAKEKGDEQDGQ